jgi:hypothetical protein
LRFSGSGANGSNHERPASSLTRKWWMCEWRNGKWNLRNCREAKRLSIWLVRWDLCLLKKGVVIVCTPVQVCSEILHFVSTPLICVVVGCPIKMMMPTEECTDNWSPYHWWSPAHWWWSWTNLQSDHLPHVICLCPNRNHYVHHCLWCVSCKCSWSWQVDGCPITHHFQFFTQVCRKIPTFRLRLTMFAALVHQT